ncbi:MAG TPA: HEPN domain-containing protein [Candidatus Paceibacterota bacterium]|nr:HEPN domain-containing protein [Candidatus Paceibacterota bacterium]
MNDKDIKEKAIFVVGLLAAFLAFSAFKEELSKISLIIFGSNFSLLGIMIFFAILLSISVYLYALDYLRYSLGKYQNFFILRWIIPLGNFFFSLAILSPILVLVAWIFGSKEVIDFAESHAQFAKNLDVILGLVLVVFSIFNAYKLTKETKRTIVKSFETVRSLYLQRALKLFENKFYTETVIEVYKTLEQFLKERIFEDKGLTTKNSGMRELMDLVIKNKVIDKKYIPLIEDLRGLRNKAAHSLNPASKEDAQFALNLVKELLESDAARFDLYSDEAGDEWIQNQIDQDSGK